MQHAWYKSNEHISRKTDGIRSLRRPRHRQEYIIEMYSLRNSV